MGKRLGAQTRAGFVSPIRRSLVDALYVPEPKRERKNTVDGRRVAGDRIKEVAGIRWQYEVLGMSVAEIAAARGKTIQEIYRTVTYTFAVHVDPAPDEHLAGGA